ncbi:single-stranded DNA-binding protein [Mucilaginibacter sp. SMC90]|uniref:single-stranded DNA-binding protein n=1 Tax=Mucilaginibacter sp. SMC90 TaxID=2929803 RepID=UPI001FB1FBFB|nr:single-stranded DNA-binding protein [Mucilaginibacter sp. SMC90]UOE47896.1 single-stranded DNA-binding protein [Mucilaginibacter sp. SMC90]
MLFTGCITADAAVREIGGAKTVTGFTLAINDRFKDRDGAKKTVTTFVECSYWVNHGLAPYLTKGLVVEIFGRVEARAWLDSENKPKPYLTCTVRDIRLCGAGARAEPPERPEKAVSPTRDATAEQDGIRSAGTSADDDDLPF